MARADRGSDSVRAPLRTTTAAVTSAVGTASAAHRAVPSSTAATTAPTIKAPSCLQRGESGTSTVPGALGDEAVDGDGQDTGHVRGRAVQLESDDALGAEGHRDERQDDSRRAVRRPQTESGTEQHQFGHQRCDPRLPRATPHERARRDAEREPGHRGGNGNEPRRITRGQCAGESHQVAGHDPREGAPERDHRHQVDRSGCRGEQHARRRRAGTGAESTCARPGATGVGARRRVTRRRGAHSDGRPSAFISSRSNRWGLTPTFSRAPPSLTRRNALDVYRAT